MAGFLSCHFLLLPSSVFLEDVSALNQCSLNVIEVGVSKVRESLAERGVHFTECGGMGIFRSIFGILVGLKNFPSPSDPRVVVGGVGFA